MKYAAYEQYKPADSSWLRHVPSHWRIQRLRFVARIQTGNTPSKSEDENYSDEGMMWVKPDDLSGFVSITNTSEYLSKIGAKLSRPVPAGSALVCCIGTVGKFGFSEQVAATNQQINAIIFDERKLSQSFGRYVIAATENEHISKANKNVVSILNATQQSNIFIPLPPLDEQQTIARFLDAKTAQIDALVAQKRQLIDKLKEKRQALIARTVTRGLPPEAAKAAGLEPNPEMKDSGVDWLGQIPGHWDIEKFSREVHIAEGQVDPEIEPFASMYLIAPNHIESGTGRLLALETAAEQFAESGKYLCPAKAVIYSKIRPALRKVVIAPELCLCSADMYPLTCKKKLLNPYLYWLLLSEQFSAWSVLEADRVAMPKINRETLNELRLPVPPQSEQIKIVEYLAAETAKVDHMLTKADTVISSLTEYRQALITSAVTGKIDVRGFAQ